MFFHVVYQQYSENWTMCRHYGFLSAIFKALHPGVRSPKMKHHVRELFGCIYILILGQSKTISNIFLFCAVPVQQGARKSPI